MRSYDIVIAGAGPAGSTLALLAARRGARVMLVERSRFDRPRVGETAPPEFRAALSHLGLGRLVSEPLCCDAAATTSIWGEAAPRFRHHIVSPYGPALHLDRNAFDKAFASEAENAGADVRIGCDVQFEPRPEGGHRVRLSTGEHVRATFAVLATGRVGGGLGLPYQRRYLDANVAVGARLRARLLSHESSTIIEAVSGGWFYFAARPDKDISIVFMTLAELVPSHREVRLQWWLRALARTRWERAAANGCRLPEFLLVRNARASFAEIGGGPNWFAIGDARIALDPLSGQGILWALDDAVASIDRLPGTSVRDPSVDMQTQTLRDVDAYLRQRSAVYSHEQRFGDDRFWESVVDRSDGFYGPKSSAQGRPTTSKPLPPETE